MGNDVGRTLTAFPSTDYAAHTIMTHAYDYGRVSPEKISCHVV